jgi:ketosteroid isomerase-like protein
MSHEDVAAIRAVIEERVSAIGAGDAARANAVLAEDIVAFEMAPPLAMTSAAVRDDAALTAWLRSWDGPISIEILNMEVAAAGDVGFAHAFHRLEGRRLGGEIVSFWFRSTLCFRKRDGRWLIVHGHSSVPFDPANEKRAALDLQP